MNELKNIKNILLNYKPEYDENIWLEIEKKLPKSKISSFKKFIIGSASGLAVVIAIFATYTIYNNTNINDVECSEKTFCNNNISKDKIPNIIENHQNSEIKKVDKNQNGKIVNTNNNEKITCETENQVIEKSVILFQNINNNENNQTEEIANNNSTTVQTNETKENTTIINNLSDINFKVEQISNCTPAKFKFSAENIPYDYTITWKTGDNNQVSGAVVEYTYNLEGNYQPFVIISKNNFVVKTENLNKIKIYTPTAIKILDNNDYQTNYSFSTETDAKNKILWTINGENFYDKKVYYNFEKIGNYIINLQITDKNGCISIDTKQITIKGEQLYYLANAFVANSTGANSTFGPIGENLKFKQYSLTIKDMQGNTVFYTQNINEQWNGKLNNTGYELPVAVYIWEIKIVDFSNNVETKKGKVNLFRQE